MQALGLLEDGASLGGFLPKLAHTPHQPKSLPHRLPSIQVANSGSGDGEVSLEDLMAQAFGGGSGSASASSEHYFNNREFVWLRHGTPAG